MCSRLPPRPAVDGAPASQHRVGPLSFDADARKQAMAQQGIDILVAGITPFLSDYGTAPSVAGPHCSRLNDHLAELVNKHPDSFRGLGMLPLQEADLAVRELERIVKELGLQGAQIGANIAGRDLDDPALFPVFEKAAELGASFLIHPSVRRSPLGRIERFSGYHLWNVVGNPLDTTIAIARVLYSGLLERLPNLKLIFSHAGGFMPYGIGRVDHAFQVRQEMDREGRPLPSTIFRRMYFDTITHHVRALEYLTDRQGPNRCCSAATFRRTCRCPIPSPSSLRRTLVKTPSAISLERTRLVCSVSRVYHPAGPGRLDRRGRDCKSVKPIAWPPGTGHLPVRTGYLAERSRGAGRWSHRGR